MNYYNQQQQQQQQQHCYTRNPLPSSLKQRQRPRVLSVFQLLFTTLSIILTYQIQTCHGFASMFVDSSSACWLDIRDTQNEIIMNNVIQPPQPSTTSSSSNNVAVVQIEVYEQTTMTPVNVHTLENDVSNTRVVYIKDFTKSNDFGQEDIMIVSFVLKLVAVVVNNEEEKGQLLPDLQYVMDARILPENENGEGGMTTMMTAEFTYNSGCENKRAHGRKGDSGLSIDIGVPASIFTKSQSQQQPQQHAVEVVAGWACGHEAVTLTYPIEFRPMIITDNADNAKEAPQEEHQIQSAKMKEVEEEEEPETDDVLPPIDDEIELETDDATAEEEKEQQGQQQRQRQIEKEQQQKHKHKLRGGQNEAVGTLQKFNQLYSKHHFGQASFTNSNYVKGLVAFVLLGVVGMKFYASKGKTSKGRREL